MLNTVLLFAAIGVFAAGFIAGMFFGAASSPWLDTETPSDCSTRTAPRRVEWSDGMFDQRPTRGQYVEPNVPPPPVVPNARPETLGADGDHLYRKAVKR